MKRRTILILSLMQMLVVAVKAQQDPRYSHYWAMEPSFNPASVGKGDKLNVVGAYALDFGGYENNPRTFYISADMPLFFMNQYHGAGVSILNDKIGLFTHQRVSGQYAFRKKFKNKGVLSLGVQAGLLLEKFNGSRVDANDPNDPALGTADVSGNSLDLGAGVYFAMPRWYIGASVQHLNAPTVTLGQTNEYKVNPAYYVTGGYTFKFRNPFLTLPTSVLGRYDGSQYRTDITARVVYTNEKKMLYAGVGYSPSNSVTAYIGGNFRGFHVGYSYEMYTGSGIKMSNGSHELFVGYQTDINLQKKGKNLHKSVRFL